ncbi:TetR/AcrR family transcriptional regulator [Paenibacillus sp. CC-CFT747]|nr:TetR/AcrR family transcriptional regulator [Paenibacillus sp. CC-CFT747]
MQCFADKGYPATTVDDIVRRLGISKGALYNYFASKEEMFTALMEERMERLIVGVKGERYDTIPDAAGKLSLIMRRFQRQALQELRPLLAFYLEFSLQASRREELRQVMLRHEQTAVAFIREVIEEGIRSGEFRPDLDSGEAASLFWALRDGIALQFIGSGEDEQYQALMRGMERMLLLYANKRPEG